MNFKSMEEKITTNQIMDYLIKMENKLESKIDSLDQKFEKKFEFLEQKFDKRFDLLFDAVGDINEKFTVMDYKFLQLKRQIHTA